jgi:hypothetical protein
MITRTMDRLTGFWKSDRGLSVFLVVLLVVAFVVYPLRREAVLNEVAVSAFYSLILFSGVMAVSSRRRDRWIAGTVAVATFVFRWASDLISSKPVLVISGVLAVVFLAMMAAVVLAQVFRKGPITIHRIVGAVAAYVLLGILWAAGYQLVLLLTPGAFVSAAGTPVGAPDLTYFSFVTLTTVGYGDVTAVNSVARSMALLEALTGQLFPAILIARLVSMEAARKLE